MNSAPPIFESSKVLTHNQDDNQVNYAADGDMSTAFHQGRVTDKVSGPALNMYTPGEIFIKPSEKFEADQDYWRGRPMPDYGGHGYYNNSKFAKQRDNFMKGEDNAMNAEVARIGVTTITNQTMALVGGVAFLFFFFNGMRF